MRYEDYKVSIASILAQLKDLGPKVNNALVSYWCPKMECFVYVGQVTKPLDEINKETHEEEKLPPLMAQQDIDGPKLE